MIPAGKDRVSEVLYCVQRGSCTEREFGRRVDADLYARAMDDCLERGYLEFRDWNLVITARGVERMEKGL